MANSFGALRLLFTLMVIWSHSMGQPGDQSIYLSGGPLSAGSVAVYGFFMISGYLVTQSLQRSSISGYLAKRGLRIYPGFIASYLVCILAVGSIFGARIDSTARIFFDLVFLQQPLPADAPFVLNGPMWTIPYEMRCYLLLLFLGVIGALRYRGLILFVVIALMALTAANPPLPISNLLAYFIGFPGYDLCFAVPFGVGALHYLYRDRIRYDGRIVLIAAPLWLVALAHAP